MSHCWHLIPDQRPSFKDLIDWLENMLQNDTQHYLDLNPRLVNNTTYLQPISKGENYFFC